MQRKNSVWSLVLALVMVLGVFAPLGALAAEAQPEVTVTKTLTLHKLMMTKEELKAWDSAAVEQAGYDGSQDLEGLKAFLGGGHSAKEAKDVFFAWQVKGKEKDGEGKNQYILGSIVEGVMTPTLTGDGQIQFTTDLDKAFGGKTTDAGIKFDTSKLKGEFLIQEIKEKSTYKADEGYVIAGQKAVPVDITLPLVNKDGVVENAHVYPKNTQDKPEIDKNFSKENDLTAIEDKESTIKAGADYANYQKDKAKAQGEVGKKIPYEVKTKINAGTSYERLIWNDIMTNGLTYDKDLELKAEGVTLEKGTDYQLDQDDNGFRLQMLDKGLEKIKAVTQPAVGDGQDVEITLTYHATVNGTAVVDHPEKNNVTLEYGHQKGKDFKKQTVTPKDGALDVKKSFEEGANTDGLKLVYTLEKDGEVKASVALDNTVTNKTIDLGNGIKFVVTTAFNGKFTGLGEDANGWKISERVAGYNPEYAEVDEAGTVTITNKKDNDNPPPIVPTTPEVIVGGKKFVKTTETETELLAGAKFVVKKTGDGGDKYLVAKSVDTVDAEKQKLAKAKTQLDTAVKNYNERQNDDNATDLKNAIDEAQTAYNAAVKTAGIRYEWGNKDDALVLASNSKGQFMIEGLEYGTYKLEEIQAPKGYAKISDVEFTVAAGAKDTDVQIKYEQTSEKPDAKRVINKKVVIPQTGGIGTAIFMVVGIALMGGAFIAMRRRNAEQA
ncbi:MAG: pilin N-terminal domain-containing protein [Peptoniphilus sp.]|nr:pilin N-terminal domain-containing protein [Peptoniphilus sp.]MDY3118223.1 pilin N-terminal domain-containing protein [Peptoniphilus sp.]